MRAASWLKMRRITAIDVRNLKALLAAVTLLDDAPETRLPIMAGHSKSYAIGPSAHRA